MKLKNNRINMKFFQINVLLLSFIILSSCVSKDKISAKVNAATSALMGTKLDERDQLAIDQTIQKALEYTPSGQAVEWRNPNSGHYGTVTPLSPFRAENGSYCREFIKTIMIQGDEQKTVAKACRQSNGHWDVLNNK
jgi:surface antigen